MRFLAIAIGIAVLVTAASTEPFVSQLKRFAQGLGSPNPASSLLVALEPASRTQSSQTESSKALSGEAGPFLAAMDALQLFRSTKKRATPKPTILEEPADEERQTRDALARDVVAQLSEIEPAAGSARAAEPDADISAADTTQAPEQVARLSERTEGTGLLLLPFVAQAARANPLPAPEMAAAKPDPTETEQAGAAAAGTAVHTTAGYVVIGSFLERGRAQIWVQARVAWQPVVLKAEVDGKERYRVAVGPFAKEDLTAALAKIRAAGIEDAWPMGTPPDAEVAAKTLEILS